jgi:TolB-like protein/Flp pilus assembly protein TadD
MKRCPECRRDYYDDTLLYCLDDGNALLEGPAYADEPSTAIMSELKFPSSGGSSSESQTGAQVHTTDRTAILRTGEKAESQEKNVKPFERQSFSAHRAAKPLAGLIVAVLVLVGGFFGYKYLGTNNSNQIESIAVLPLANVNADPDTEYLSDGITESIINKLSQFPKLRVMARSTVFTYKGQEMDPRKVGRDLGVGAVMTGRLTRQNDRLIVTLELVRVTDGTQIWGQRYDRKQSDMLAMQQDISQEVSDRLHLRLSAEEKQQFNRDYTRNVEAYQLYLKGRYFWNKFDPESLKKSIEYYNQALDKDPNYALAYVGIADAYSVLANNYVRPRENYPKSAAAVAKALELDPTLTEAHITLGFIKFFYEWDWPAVERQVRSLLESNPNDPNVHTLNSYYLRTMGQRDEALKESKRALELDPLSSHLSVDLASHYVINGQCDEAIGLLRKTLETDPRSTFVRLYLGWAYDQNGNYQEAIANYDEVIRQIGRDPYTLAYLGHAHGMSGNRAEAKRLLGELTERSKQAYVFPLCLVYIYVGLGDKVQAFTWLEKAYEEKDTNLIAPGIRFDPMLEPLRSDPRFADLLRRMNLQE